MSLPDDDPVYTLKKSFGGSRFCKLTCYSSKGRGGYNPIMMYSLVTYANMRGVRAVDRIVELCERDLAFIWCIYRSDSDICGPHLHNLRHTFCVHSLEAMLCNGTPHQTALPLLMTYLGHSSLSATGRYLKLTAKAFPDLNEKISSIFLTLHKSYTKTQNHTLITDARHRGKSSAPAWSCRSYGRHP